MTRLCTAIAEYLDNHVGYLDCRYLSVAAFLLRHSVKAPAEAMIARALNLEPELQQAIPLNREELVQCINVCRLLPFVKPEKMKTINKSWEALVILWDKLIECAFKYSDFSIGYLQLPKITMTFGDGRKDTIS